MFHTGKQLRMDSHGGSRTLAEFPLDIIFNIFSRLPADILIGIRRVCKLWNKLIRDPDFIELHLSTWMHKSPSRLIIAPPTGYSCTEKLLLVDGIEERHWRGRKIQVKYLPEARFLLYGCCNGLICMGSSARKSESIFICNPITGDIMCLPKPNLAAKILGFRTTPHYYTIGFGFDNATKKYKVVRLGLFYTKDNQNQLLVEILTIGESSWRMLDVPEITDWYDFSQMLFLNGSVYWINYGHEYNGHEFILAFEIGSEKFGVIDFPCLEQDKFRSGLMNMEGSLALVAVHSHPWIGVMKTSRVWRIVGSLETGFCFKLSSSYVYCDWKHTTLYGLFSDGTLLLKHQGRDFSFTLNHPRRNKFFPFQVSGYSPVCESILFMPSLVSLPQ